MSMISEINFRFDGLKVVLSFFIYVDNLFKYCWYQSKPTYST